MILTGVTLWASIGYAWNGGLQISSYYDTNLRESPLNPTPGTGLFLEGDIGQNTGGDILSFTGEVLTQAYMDVRKPEESKLVFLPELGVHGDLFSRTKYRASVNHFRKHFTEAGRYMSRTEGGLGFSRQFSVRITADAGYRYSQSEVKFADQYRYDSHFISAGLGIRLPAGFSVDLNLDLSRIFHHDYLAWRISGDSVLIRGSDFKEDTGGSATLQILYQGRRIWGAQLTYQRVNSNSVTGRYRRIRLYAYLSGHIGPSGFYHLAGQYTFKQYRYKIDAVRVGYRDPETVPQNKIHLRLEQKIGTDLYGYVQLSYIRSESFFNREYYEKALLKAGVMYSL